MRRLLYCVSLLVIFANSGCGAPSGLEPTALTGDQSRWIGTFSGTWDGMCDRQAPGSFRLLSFDGNKGRVEWTWSCGRAESITRSARLEGDVLVVDLRGRREARYRFVDEDTVEGVFVAPDIQVRHSGTFTRS